MFSLNRRFPLFRKAIIAVFAVPLMFAGGSFLGGLAQSQTVGEVGSIDIPRGEFEGRYQRAVEEFRRNSGSEEIPSVVAENISRQVQSELLSYYLMRASVEKKGIYAPDSAVAAEIRQTPDFLDEDGNFSPDLYNEFVSDRRYFQERVRESIGREPVFRTMRALPLEKIRDKLAAFRQQQRLTEQAVLPVTALSTVVIDIPPDDVNLYYQQNRNAYRRREEAGFQYFIFSLDSFAANYTVSIEDARVAYEDFTAEEDERARRQISHIYLSDEEDAAAVYDEAVADSARFAELAAQYSEDVGSADAGGSMGIVAFGDLPLEMNDVVFTLTVGQVAAPVLLEDGAYSILKLDALIREPLPPFAAVEDEMLQRARREAAADDFAAAVEDLRERAPEEIGSLALMASLASTSVTAALTVYRDDEAENAYPFDSEATLLDAFDPLVISDGENSEPIPLEEEAYLFVRALRYQEGGVQPLDSVRADIEDTLYAVYLVQDLQRQLAGTETANTLSNPAAGSVVDVQQLLDSADWGQPSTLVLADNGRDETALNSTDGDGDSGSDEANSTDADTNLALDYVFSADLSRGLPAYAFVPDKELIKIFRISEIREGEALAEDYEVIDELIDTMTTRLSGAGYLDELIGQYDYEFYNLPPLTSDSSQ